MNEMEDFPDEFTKPFLLCFNILKRCNIRFFDSNLSVFKKYWRFFFITPFVLIHYISLSAYTIRMFTSEMKISELVFMVPVFLILTQGLIKAALIIPRKADTVNLIKELGSMWRTENLNDYQTKKKNRFLKRLNFCLAGYYWGTMMASWQNLLVPLAITLFRKIFHEDDTDFLLPLGCVYPFNPVKNWMRYIAIYAFQIYTTFHYIHAYIGTEFAMITICAHLSTEFALLREDLKQIKPRKDKNQPKNEIINSDDNSGNSLKNIIWKHQKLIQLTCSLNNIFSVTVFIDFLFATVITCFFCFGATVAHGAVDIANNLITIFALLLPIYIICYYAELLKIESSGIAESAYDNVWYNYGTHYQNAIRLIILGSQRPCCLTSLNYFPITMNTFTKVISTTWSYFSLARSLYSDN